MALTPFAEDGLVLLPSSGLAQRRTKPKATTTPLIHLAAMKTHDRYQTEFPIIGHP